MALTSCPNCGHENSDGDRFCSNCGTRLTPVSVPTDPDLSTENVREAQEQSLTSTADATPVASSIPPPVTPSFARSTNDWDIPRDREPVDDDWKMSDLGPPPARKRRVWLWVIVAILAALVLGCCGFMFFITATDTGSQWFNDLATQVSEQATEQAR